MRTQFNSEPNEPHVMYHERFITPDDAKAYVELIQLPPPNAIPFIHEHGMDGYKPLGNYLYEKEGKWIPNLGYLYYRPVEQDTLELAVTQVNDVIEGGCYDCIGITSKVLKLVSDNHVSKIRVYCSPHKDWASFCSTDLDEHGIKEVEVIKWGNLQSEIKKNEIYDGLRKRFEEKCARDGHRYRTIFFP